MKNYDRKLARVIRLGSAANFDLWAVYNGISNASGIFRCSSSCQSLEKFLDAMSTRSAHHLVLDGKKDKEIFQFRDGFFSF